MHVVRVWKFYNLWTMNIWKAFLTQHNFFWWKTGEIAGMIQIFLTSSSFVFFYIIKLVYDTIVFIWSFECRGFFKHLYACILNSFCLIRYDTRQSWSNFKTGVKSISKHIVLMTIIVLLLSNSDSDNWRIYMRPNIGF